MAFYWYQSDPQLYQAEVAAMQKFFPSFRINQLQDGSGRLYWRGKVQPMGEGGMVWDLMLIYKNDHPHASEGEYGGSIQILPIQPRLKDIAQKMMPLLEQTYGSYDNCVKRGFGLGLPHIYRNNFGRNEEYFIYDRFLDISIVYHMGSISIQRFSVLFSYYFIEYPSFCLYK